MQAEKLIRQLKQKKRSALEKAIRQYTGYVSVVVYNILGDSLAKEDREEIIADVFLALWENSDSLDEAKGNLQGYLAAIARNKAKNALRKRRNEIPLEGDEWLFKDCPEGEAAKQELLAALIQGVEALPQPEREIFLRYYYRGEKINRIADNLEMNPATVKTKLARSRGKLKSTLIERGYNCEDANF